MKGNNLTCPVVAAPMGICLSANASSRTTSPPPSPSSLASSHPPSSSSSCLVPRTAGEDDDKGAEAANFPPPVAAASDSARKKRRGRRMEAPRRRGEEEEGRPQIIFARLLPPSFPLCHPPPAYARRKSLNFFPSPFQLPPLPATMWCTHSPFFSGTKALFYSSFLSPSPLPLLLSLAFPSSFLCLVFRLHFRFPLSREREGEGESHWLRQMIPRTLLLSLFVACSRKCFSLSPFYVKRTPVFQSPFFFLPLFSRGNGWKGRAHTLNCLRYDVKASCAPGFE